MAFEVQKIEPIDLRPKVAVGVSIPFNGPGIFRSTYTTKDQLKSNIINFFLTNNNERYFNNNFGGDFRSSIFEQISSNTIDDIEDSIKSAFYTYFPTVILNKVIIQGDPDMNTISISIKYSISNSNIEDDLTLNFVNG